MDIETTWIVYGTGGVGVNMKIRRNPVFLFLPRFGIRLFLTKEMSRVSYCGTGSNSCGPELAKEEYRLDEEEFSFAVRILPEWHCR